MNNLSNICKNLKKDFTPKIQNPTKPVASWSEKDIINKKTVDAFVIIFRTRGCSWALSSGCSMCGYFNDSLWKKVTGEDLLKQFNTAMQKYNNEPFVKIFNSGSFFDEKEIPKKIQTQILTDLAKTTEKISVESRPEYITNEKLKNVKKTIGSTSFEIGIGLETADDKIREKSINKGFTFNDYKKAVETTRKNKFNVKTYVTVKPLFLTEKEAINDCIDTVKKIKNTTDTISFNPVNVQRNTLVEYLWRRNQYRPSWLWSAVEILKESKKITKDVYVKCDVAGGGSIRGAHNCKNCDREVLNAISKFSLSQDEKVFNNLSCDCYEKWLDQLDIENLGFGSLTDLSRMI